MKQFLLDNKRFLELLLITLIILSFFAAVFLNAGSIFGAIGKMIGILAPFIVGFVIAYLLKPVVKEIEKWIGALIKKMLHKNIKSCRGWAILVTFILVIGALALLICAVIPGLVSSIQKLVNQAPGAYREFERWLRGLAGNSDNDLIAGLNEILNNAFDGIYDNIKGSLLPNLENLATGLTAGFTGMLGILKNILIGCVVAVYMLAAWEKFGAQAKILLYGLAPERFADWISSELKLTDQLFGGFISGKIIDSFIIGVICFICCVLMNMPYALLVSVIVGVTNIIPFFGPYIGAVPSAILILIESPFKCIIFIIFIILLQQLDGNVIGPKILGDRVGISSFWILFAILFFGSYWGIIGMIVGVPVFGVIYDLVRRIVLHGIDVHNKSELLAEYRKEFGEDSDGNRDKPEKKKLQIPFIKKKT